MLSKLLEKEMKQEAEIQIIVITEIEVAPFNGELVNGKFVKTVFTFLQPDAYGKCKIIVTKKAVNHRDVERMVYLVYFDWLGNTHGEKLPEKIPDRNSGHKTHQTITQTLPLP